ncbi:DUF4307 domain-containing protein [Demequina mangrovi]|uniref:DUF4307 domain-containing protein n=1 Tax=Demequina mangrovi TaxID=1043493 RepID=A0A1H6YFE6_9MICO|nr:DUF4307 domain-containing protein [Demequina mangrovi]SEJ35475.1 protein of unknown function [Demequina mangrovi]
MSTPEPDEGTGAVPRLSPRTWALVIAGIVALVGVTAWYAFVASHEAVRWKDVGFSVVSPTEITVTYDVYLYDDVDADCTLRALNTRFTEVGVATQRVSLEDGRQQRLEATLTTTEEATTAQVNYCVPVD